MAKKKTKRQSTDNDANVVRIKAGAPTAKKAKNEPEEAIVIKSSATAKAATKGKPVKAKKIKKPRSPKGWVKPFRAVGAYFKGAWYELRQVRWPTRQATWSMTVAVLLYTAFFVVVILLLDAAFKYLFELILGN